MLLRDKDTMKAVITESENKSLDKTTLVRKIRQYAYEEETNFDENSIAATPYRVILNLTSLNRQVLPHTMTLPSPDIVKAKISQGRIFTVGDYSDMFSQIRASKKYSNYYGIQLAHDQYYKSKTCI